MLNELIFAAAAISGSGQATEEREPQPRDAVWHCTQLADREWDCYWVHREGGRRYEHSEKHWQWHERTDDSEARRKRDLERELRERDDWKREQE